MKKLSAGFTLVEVVFALGIASFCLMSIVGLLPIGLSSSVSATTQTGAVNIMTAIVADLHNTPNGSGQKSPLYSFDIGNPLNSSTLYFDEGGGGSASPVANSRYRVTVTNVSDRANLNSQQRRASSVRILVSWPALTTISNALGSVDTCVNLDRN
jgi:uncharacterized protein (TIGR02598 family)